MIEEYLSDSYNTNAECMKEANDLLETAIEWGSLVDEGLGNLEKNIFHDHRALYRKAAKSHYVMEWKGRVENNTVPESSVSFESEIARAKNLQDRYEKLLRDPV